MQKTIEDSLSARQLGYYIFFNLRQQDSRLAIQKHEVEEAASAAGLRHLATAWELFDRNSDDCATLEEVIDGVQQVRAARTNSPACDCALGGGAVRHGPRVAGQPRNSWPRLDVTVCAGLLQPQGAGAHADGQPERG